MSGDQGETDSTNLSSAVREFGWWGAFWGWLVGTFLLFATITNLLHGLFDFQLLPIFQNTLTDLRAFVHWVLDTFLFSWILWTISHLCLGLTTLLSLVMPDIAPWLPDIVIPDWYKDLALVSAVATRAAIRGYTMSSGTPRTEESESSDHQWKHAAREHPILRVAVLVLLYIRDPIGSVFTALTHATAWATWRVTGSYLIARAAGSTVLVASHAVSLLGLLSLATDTLFAVYWSRVMQAGPDKSGRWLVSAMLWTWFSLVMAIAASIGFFVWNGYALDALAG